MNKDKIYIALLIFVILGTSFVGKLVVGTIIQNGESRSPCGILVVCYPGVIMFFRYCMCMYFYQWHLSSLDMYCHQTSKENVEHEHTITISCMIVGLLYLLFA
jgi:hypothetical protein